MPCYRLKTSKLIFDIRNDNLDYGDKMSASGNRNQSGIMLTKFQGFWNSRMSNGRRISPLAIILLIALIFYSLMILKRTPNAGQNGVSKPKRRESLGAGQN